MKMSGRVFRVAIAILLTIFVQLLLKEVFDLRLRNDAKLLKCIAHGCGTRIEAPVALALPFSSSPSVSLKQERDGDKNGKDVQPPKKQ